MRLLISISILFFLISCGDPTAALRTEVMAIHDETMKQMGAIRKAKSQLSSADLVKDLPLEEVHKAIIDLKVADSLMMDWMRNYKEPSDPAQIKAYLQGELVSIKKVDEAITSSMAQANKLLAQ